MRQGGIGGSLLLVAVGAILYWAVETEAQGFNINMAGMILMAIGAVGLVLSLIVTSSEEAASDRDVTIIER